MAELEDLSQKIDKTNGYLDSISDNAGCGVLAAWVLTIGGCVGGTFSAGAKLDDTIDAIKENTIELREFREEFKKQHEKQQISNRR